jgi:hypothetical protein
LISLFRIREGQEEGNKKSRTSAMALTVIMVAGPLPVWYATKIAYSKQAEGADGPPPHSFGFQI